MIFKSYKEVVWDHIRWPNFTPKELACRCPSCNGEFWHQESAFDAIQLFRRSLNSPVYINSAHRCSVKNKIVGGATNSMHLKIAFDVSIKRCNWRSVILAAKQAGFTGIGLYTTFIHLDLGRRRHWFGGDQASTKWHPYLLGVEL